MGKLELTQQVNAPVERVFEIAADIPNCAASISGIECVEMLTDGPVGAGTRWRRRLMGKHKAVEVLSITEFEPNRRYTVGCTSCGCSYATTFHFEPRVGGTQVRLDMNTRPVTLVAKLVSPLFGLIFGPMMKRCMQKDLADLKAAAEA